MFNPASAAVITTILLARKKVDRGGNARQALSLKISQRYTRKRFGIARLSSIRALSDAFSLG